MTTMAVTAVLGIIGGLLVTVVFVAFVILLLKIVRAVLVKGVQNQTLASLLKHEMGGEEDTDGDDGVDAGADDTSGADSTGSDGGAADDVEEEKPPRDFWSSVHPDDTFSYPSPVRLAKSSAPSTYVIRSSAGKKTSVYNVNGTGLTIVYATPDHPIGDDTYDTRLFLVHYFELAHFEPGDKDKPVDERRDRYVVFESAVYKDYFIHYETLTEVYGGVYLKMTNNRPLIEDTVTTDDRFFKMRVHDTVDGMDRVKLEHISTNQWLSVGPGFTAPMPILRPMSSGVSDVDLFFIEETLVNI